MHAFPRWEVTLADRMYRARCQAALLCSTDLAFGENKVWIYFSEHQICPVSSETLTLILVNIVGLIVTFLQKEGN